MMSRVMKKEALALVFVAGAGLALLGPSIMAAAFVLDWRVIGFGMVSGSCQATFGPNCTSNSTGSVQGTHVGSGTYSLSLKTGNDNATNANGGKCLPANGVDGLSTPNNVTAADGAIIRFDTVGWLCEEAGSSSPYHYNGTYRIISGTGRFSNVMGGGNLSATFEKGGSNNTFVKVDGTINF